MLQNRFNLNLGVIEINKPVGFFTLSLTNQTKVFPLVDPHLETGGSPTSSRQIMDYGDRLVMMDRTGWQTVSISLTIGDFAIQSLPGDFGLFTRILESVEQALIENAGIEKMAAEKDVAALILSGKNNNSVRVRAAAAKKLINLGHPCGVEIILQVLRSLPDSEIILASDLERHLNQVSVLDVEKVLQPQEDRWKANRSVKPQIPKEALVNAPFQVGDIVKPVRHFGEDGSNEGNRFYNDPLWQLSDTIWKVLEISTDGVFMMLLKGTYRHYVKSYPGDIEQFKRSYKYKTKFPNKPEFSQVFDEFQKIK